MPENTVQKRSMMSIQAIPDISAIRTATLLNQEHTVIPCIALCEGVLWPSNAPKPELALAEEFGRFPEGWNGRPVVLNHPKIDDEPVSASSPEVLKDFGIGQIFNTELKDNKLHMELWINEDRVAEIGDTAVTTLKRLKDGDEIVEVSTGLFTMQEIIDGEFDGEEFSAIWRNIVPDHLAILEQGLIGACSVEGGAGAPRLNTDEHVVKSGLRSLVMHEYNDDAPVINAEDGERGEQGIFKRLLTTVKDVASLFNFKSNASLSDSDLRKALNSALTVAEDGGWTWILAVFQSDGTIVYEAGWNGELFRRTFSIEDSGTVTISSEREAVRPVTTFVPVEIVTNESSSTNVPSAQESTMKTKEELVKSLIDNTSTQYTEEDSGWLQALEESQLLKMVPNEEDASDEDDDEDSAGAAAPSSSADSESGASDEEEDEELSTEEYISKAPVDMQEVLNEGLTLQKARKNHYIKELLNNDRNEFSEGTLRAMATNDLENIASLANVPSYDASALVLSGARNDTSNDGTAPAPLVFNLKRTGTEE